MTRLFKRTCATLAATALAAACGGALAAGRNPLSVHVLNLQDGLPSPGVEVTLERKTGSDWQPLGSAVTNEQGRITALYPEGQEFASGQYRVVFKTGDYYAKRRVPTFFPEVPVLFTVEPGLPHYHIPLLLSPYGYTTYRGS